MKYHPSTSQEGVIPDRVEKVKYHPSKCQEGVIPNRAEIMKHHPITSQEEVIPKPVWQMATLVTSSQFATKPTL